MSLPLRLNLTSLTGVLKNLVIRLRWLLRVVTEVRGNLTNTRRPSTETSGSTDELSWKNTRELDSPRSKPVQVSTDDSPPISLGAYGGRFPPEAETPW